MKRRYYKNDQLIEVIEPKINGLYHLSWAGRGCVWKLKEIKGEWVKLETPKTHKEQWAKRSDLRHTRKTQMKIESVKND